MKGICNKVTGGGDDGHRLEISIVVGSKGVWWESIMEKLKRARDWVVVCGRGDGSISWRWEDSASVLEVVVAGRKRFEVAAVNHARKMKSPDVVVPSHWSGKAVRNL